MPPKQQSKADLAKKQKIVEDKTFGLKNKNKSKNVQKYVQSLKQSVQPKLDDPKAAAKVRLSLTFPLLFFYWLPFVEKSLGSCRGIYCSSKPWLLRCTENLGKVV